VRRLSAALVPTLCAAALLGSTSAYAAPVAYLFWGERDPSGVDEAFLELGRRRGAPTARETAGQLGHETLRSRLQAATQAFRELRFAEAITQLDGLERDVASHGGGGLTQGELVDLFATRAAARGAEAAEAPAWDDLLVAAALAPNRPLDPARFPPRTLDAARRAAESLPALASLTVSSTPVDAEIIVDGQLLGRGAVTLQRPPGRHFVRAERAGLEPYGRVIDLAPEGSTVTLALGAPTAADPARLARSGTLLGAERVLAASIVAKGDHAALSIRLLDTARARVANQTSIEIDGELTNARLSDAIDALLATPLPRPPERAAPRSWLRRGVILGVSAGLLGAAAIGLGIGFGFSGQGHGVGFSAHTDLGPAR
jgi:hypothetical protein